MSFTDCRGKLDRHARTLDNILGDVAAARHPVRVPQQRCLMALESSNPCRFVTMPKGAISADPACRVTTGTLGERDSSPGSDAGR